MDNNIIKNLVAKPPENPVNSNKSSQEKEFSPISAGMDNSTIKTDVDDLIKLVEKKKRVSLSEAAKVLGVPVQTVEAWSIFLEEDGLVEVEYKLTTPYLVQKSVKAEEKPAEKPQLSTPETTSLDNPKPITAEEVYPHLLDNASNQLDLLFKKAYEYIEEKKFNEARHIYEVIKQETETLPLNLKELKKDTSANLTKLNRDIGVHIEHYHNENAKEIIKEIQIKIQRLNQSLTAANLKKADTLFHEIQSLFASFPDGFESLKTDLQKEINESYKTLLNKKEELLLNYNSKKAAEITALIKEIKTLIQQNNIQSAITKYEKAKEFYQAIPLGFAEETLPIKNELFTLAQQIISLEQESNKEEFTKYQTQFKQEVNLSYESLTKGDFEDAETHLRAAREIQGKLPKEFFKKRNESEHELIELENTLLEKSKNTALTKLRDETGKINHLLKTVQDYLKNDNIELAEGAYYEILHHYNQIPDGFLEQKTAINVTIFDLFREIILKHDEVILTEFDESTSVKYKKILQLLISLKTDMEFKHFDIVGAKYNELADLFGRLPFKFVQDKTSLWKEIISLSKLVNLYSICTQLDSPNLDPSLLKTKLTLVRDEYMQLIKSEYDNPSYSSILALVREKISKIDPMTAGMLESPSIIGKSTSSKTSKGALDSTKIIPPSDALQETSGPKRDKLSPAFLEKSMSKPYESIIPTTRSQPYGPDSEKKQSESVLTTLPSHFPFRSKSIGIPSDSMDSLDLNSHTQLPKDQPEINPPLKPISITGPKKNPEKALAPLYPDTIFTPPQIVGTPFPSKNAFAQNEKQIGTPVPVRSSPPKEGQSAITIELLKENLLTNLLQRADQRIKSNNLEAAKEYLTEVLSMDAFNKQAKETLAKIEKQQNIEQKTLDTSMPPNKYIDKKPKKYQTEAKSEKEYENRKLLSDIKTILSEAESDAQKGHFFSLEKRHQTLIGLVSEFPAQKFENGELIWKRVLNLSRAVELYKGTKNLESQELDKTKQEKILDSAKTLVTLIGTNNKTYSRLLRYVEDKHKQITKRILGSLPEKITSPLSTPKSISNTSGTDLDKLKSKLDALSNKLNSIAQDTPPGLPNTNQNPEKMLYPKKTSKQDFFHWKKNSLQN